MAGKEKKGHDALIVIANKLNEARYRLTLREQRLILYMISTIQPNDEDFKPYRVAVTDFAHMMGIVDDGAYKAIKAITKGLIEQVLEIPKPTGLLQIAWLSSAEYIDKEGYVELCFDPKLKPYLLHLRSQFTQFKLENVVRLNSVYSIRIYTLLMQYWRIGERTFQVKDLRRILGITDSEYPLYGHFKQRVILTAQAELAKSTDLSFTFQEIKTGRKVTGIEFTITVKPPEPTEAKATTPINVTTTAPEVEPHDIPLPDITILVNLLPIEHRQKKTFTDAITKAYKEHGLKYTAYNIKYTNANCKDKAKYRVYLNKALANNYAEGLAEDAEANKQATVKKQEAKKKEDAGRHDKELYDRAIEYIAKIKPQERKKLEAEAIATLPLEQQEKVKASNFFALKGLQFAMQGIVMERLATSTT